MYMFEAFSSILNLRFTNPPTYCPLPDHITRTFVSASTNINLELLICKPSTTQPNDPPPILFLHGGFGSASVWLPFMTYLHNSNPRTTTYALSYRGHGASSSVSYLRMVYGTTAHDIIHDISVAIKHITAQHNNTAPILAAHSSSGGLVSMLLSSSSSNHQPQFQQEREKLQNFHTPALILLDAVPHFGNLNVYANWARHDPWFLLRMLIHLQHPISPLSSWTLVRNAFFGSSTTTTTSDGGETQVREFMRWMPKYESLMWPLAMTGSFWAWLMGKPSWIDAKRIVEKVGVDVDGWRGGVRMRTRSDRICVVVGDKDVLMDVDMCRRAVAEYRCAVRELTREKKIEGSGVVDAEHDDSEVQVDLKIEGAIIESRDGVRFVVVEGAGHHVQNDVQWEVAAEVVSRFVKQL